jgi:hypothetical protein
LEQTMISWRFGACSVQATSHGDVGVLLVRGLVTRAGLSEALAYCGPWLRERDVAAVVVNFRSSVLLLDPRQGFDITTAALGAEPALRLPTALLVQQAGLRGASLFSVLMCERGLSLTAFSASAPALAWASRHARLHRAWCAGRVLSPESRQSADRTAAA